ncbi:hypothetical protein CWM53_18415 [Klebsiella sp. A-Nf5]|nr:hypothetical protein CWM53_18415 [Klebsiella sp. A-Nf5]
MMPLFCRVAAAPDPAYRAALSAKAIFRSVGPRKRSAAGRQVAAMMPFFCRVAATPDPAYRAALSALKRFFGP